MRARTRVRAWVWLLAALAVVMPIGAAAYMIVPQDSKSKALLALAPDEADRVRRRALMSDLQPTGQFLTSPNGNVYGMTFVTWPYPTDMDYVCREDSITLQHGEDRFGKEPHQIEAQALYYVDGDASISGDHLSWQGCDRRHPGPKAHWFSAPRAYDAVRATEIFREAQDEVASGVVTPAPCGRSGPDACRQWILSLKDSSKIDAVETCPSDPGPDVCYVISMGDERLTIGAKMFSGHPAQIDITSIKVEQVITVME
jgi:hypothetical protein